MRTDIIQTLFRHIRTIPQNHLPYVLDYWLVDELRTDQSAFCAMGLNGTVVILQHIEYNVVR